MHAPPSNLQQEFKSAVASLQMHLVVSGQGARPSSSTSSSSALVRGMDSTAPKSGTESAAAPSSASDSISFSIHQHGELLDEYGVDGRYFADEGALADSQSLDALSDAGDAADSDTIRTSGAGHLRP